MAAEKSGSKTDTLVKVVLVFFISLLSFSVGTFVGKQVSDSDHRRMALEGESKADRQVASEDHEEDSEKISDKEVESLTEEFVNKEKAATGEEASHQVKTETPEPEEKADATGYKSFSRSKGKGDATHKVAEKVAEGDAPSDGKHEQRKPAAVLPSVAASAVGKYTVQVGAYADEKEAKTHAAELKSKGWNAFYISADVKGRTWFRVSVGLFGNMKSADEYRAQFMKEANTKSAIVQKIIQ